MATTWPAWAAVRADEVPTLPPEEWGPWAQGGTCVRAPIGDHHPIEAPHFFYCQRHMAVLREQHPAPAANADRDAGLCVRCKGPAERHRKVVRVDPVACAEAERLGITVARLSTRKFCASCDPWAAPFCQTAACKAAGRKVRALPKGCCKWTATPNHRPHCQACHDDYVAARAITAMAAVAKRPTLPELPDTLCAATKCEPCNAAEVAGRFRAPALDCHNGGGSRPHCRHEHDRRLLLQRLTREQRRVTAHGDQLKPNTLRRLEVRALQRSRGGGEIPGTCH